MKRLSATLATLLLVACGSTPKPVDPPTEGQPKPAARTPTKKPNVVLKRGGGFYKDDGPADDIPDGLDDIPDAEPKFEPLHRFANKPYVVLGKEYVPNTSLKPYKVRGIGSWYGKKFHGQKTSIGEPYDMFAMTAAHPTLAVPSYVRVTSIDTGRSVIVRVTDRGPFHADRVIDLSYTAAYKLGYIQNGSGMVEVEAILPEPGSMTYAQVAPKEVKPVAGRPSLERDEIAAVAKKLAAEEAPTQTAAMVGMSGNGGAAAVAAGGVFLQLGAFANADNAETARLRLTRELDWVGGEIRVNIGGGIHRLHLGPYPNRAEAEKIAEKIKQEHGFKPTFVIR